MKMAKEMFMIDTELKWINLYPQFCEWIDEGSKEQKELVKKELKKLCECADYVRQEQKAQEKKK